MAAPSERQRQLEGSLAPALAPVSLPHFATNVLTAGHYISDPHCVSPLCSCGRRGGADPMTQAFQWLLFSPPLQLLTCGCLPRWVRLHNSYVRWSPGERTLYGTDGRGGEFGYVRATTFWQSGLHLCVFATLTGLVVAFPSAQGFSPSPLLLPTSPPLQLLDLTRALYGLFLAGSLLALLTLLLQLTGAALVGSRRGALPQLLPMLLSSPAPQFMVSYSWAPAAGHARLARAFFELCSCLPHPSVIFSLIVPTSRQCCIVF